MRSRTHGGYTLVEALVVLVLVGLMTGLAVPALAELRARGRAAAGARYMAGLFQQMRWRAVARSRAHGLLFEHDGRGWTWRIAQDGNGNGMRTAEVSSGIDPTLSGPHRLDRVVEQVDLGFPGAGPFPRVPPGRGIIDDPTDPVKFGRANLVSFTRLGRASSGTLYVTDNRRELFAVVLFGPTARVRVWRHDRGRWTR
jgi:type II secretory pathway pseudopilin PulG